MHRRQFLKTSAAICAVSPVFSDSLLHAQETTDLAVVKNGEPAALVRNAVDALGGMSRFVNKNDVVVLKPNISWDRVPPQAATTNPESVAEVVKMCLESGASKVIIFDNTLNEPRRCYKRSGIQAAAEAAGADVQHVHERKFKRVAFPEGKLIRNWEVYDELLEADTLINMPAAKHHSISGVSLGMKNLMGVLGGVRGKIHRQFDTKLVDINTLVRPKLTILDAYRMLLRNGPSGGNPADVALTRTVVAGTDPVAVDSYGVTLFGLDPLKTGFLVEASARQLGQNRLDKLNIRTIALNS